jgi:hypothetical protein
MSTQAAVDPFPPSIRTEFSQWIEAPGYTNRERIPYTKWVRMQVFLDDKDLKPENAADSNTKFRALTEFELINRRLHRKPDAKHELPRYAVPGSEAFDLVVREHLRLLHAGRDKTWAAIELKYYGIQKQDVNWIVAHCRNCILNRPSASKAPLQPITSNNVFERVQIDLIDMRHEPSERYQWILHVKDHFSKYSMLYALHSKHAEGIADALGEFIKAFGPPKIVQCDNGKEFKGMYYHYLCHTM